MYDHHQKAGNQGDVVKHVALVAVLSEVLPARREFVYADSFAGYAFNPLTLGGDWSLGIGGLKNLPPAANSHVQCWRSFWDCGLPLLGQ